MKKNLSIISLILWMGIIFIFSHQPSDASTESSQFIVLFLTDIAAISPTFLSRLISNLLIPYIRELAHIFLYIVLGMVLLNAYYVAFLSVKTKELMALFAGITYAIFDEIHQYFIPGRAFQIIDILLDTIGLIIGIGILMFVNKFITKKIFKKERIHETKN
ncbi:MAG: VanZ family protein [Candidatus Izimaplasma sp.]|nr:VanZ family protein [Candidatus Izimaplasma bacterium]